MFYEYIEIQVLVLIAFYAVTAFGIKLCVGCAYECVGIVMVRIMVMGFAVFACLSIVSTGVVHLVSLVLFSMSISYHNIL